MLSVENAALISGHHVLDVDECVLAAVDFEQFQGLLNEVSEVLGLALAVVNFVSQVLVLDLK